MLVLEQCIKGHARRLGIMIALLTLCFITCFPLESQAGLSVADKKDVQTASQRVEKPKKPPSKPKTSTSPHQKPQDKKNVVSIPKTAPGKPPNSAGSNPAPKSKPEEKTSGPPHLSAGPQKDKTSVKIPQVNKPQPPPRPKPTDEALEGVDPEQRKPPEPVSQRRTETQKQIALPARDKPEKTTSSNQKASGPQPNKKAAALKQAPKPVGQQSQPKPKPAPVTGSKDKKPDAPVQKALTAAKKQDGVSGSAHVGKSNNAASGKSPSPSKTLPTGSPEHPQARPLSSKPLRLSPADKGETEQVKKAAAAPKKPVPVSPSAFNKFSSPPNASAKQPQAETNSSSPTLLSGRDPPKKGKPPPSKDPPTDSSTDQAAELTLVELRLNQKFSTEIEVLVWPDGQISVPAKTLLRLYDFAVTETNDGQNHLKLLDPDTQNEVVLDWDTQTAELGGETIQNFQHPLKEILNGFIIPQDIYIDAALAEKILDDRLHFDKDNLLLEIQTHRHPTVLARTVHKPQENNGEDEPLLQPPVKNAWLDKIYLSYRNNTSYRINIPIAPEEPKLYTGNILSQFTTGISGTIAGTDYLFKPTFTRINGNMNIQKLDWNLKRTAPGHVLMLGSVEAGLSDLVSPRLPIWGLYIASPNALQKKVTSTVKVKKKAKRIILVNYNPAVSNSAANDISTEQKAYDPEKLEPVTLDSGNQAGSVQVLDMEPNSEQVLPYKIVNETLYSNQKLLADHEKAYSAFIGRVPLQFYPVNANSYPILLKQSEKWVAGGRLFYGVSDQLTVGISASADRIFGKAHSNSVQSFLQFLQTAPGLTGINSYRRDPNFFQGESLGVSLDYQLSDHIAISTDIAGSYYEVKPGFSTPVKPQGIGGAGQLEVAYTTKPLSVGLSLFHYDTDFYTPMTLSNNNLYDRQGLALRLNGHLGKPVNLGYRFSWSHYQSNLDRILSGGLINADTYSASLSKQFAPWLNASANISWTSGHNSSGSESEYKNGGFNLSGSLPKQMSYIIQYQQFASSNVFVPIISPFNPQVITFTDQKIDNYTLNSSLRIPLPHDTYLQINNLMSKTLDYISLEGGFHYRNLYIEPLIQKGIISDQRLDRIGARISYKFPSNRSLSLHYYYNLGTSPAVDLLGANKQRSHQFYFDFSDVLAMIGDRFHSAGSNADNNARLSGKVYVDLNHDGRLSSEDSAIHQINLILDHNKTISPDLKGQFNLSNLSPGEHTLELSADNLPITINPDNSIYKINLIRGRQQTFNFPVKAETGAVSGTVHVHDIAHAVYQPTGMLMVLLDEKENVIRYTEINADGSYLFDNLSPRHYKIDIDGRSKNSGRYKILKSPADVILTMPSDIEEVIEKRNMDFEILRL